MDTAFLWAKQLDFHAKLSNFFHRNSKGSLVQECKQKITNKLNTEAL